MSQIVSALHGGSVRFYHLALVCSVFFGAVRAEVEKPNGQAPSAPIERDASFHDVSGDPYPPRGPDGIGYGSPRDHADGRPAYNPFPQANGHSAEDAPTPPDGEGAGRIRVQLSGLPNSNGVFEVFRTHGALMRPNGDVESVDDLVVLKPEGKQVLLYARGGTGPQGGNGGKGQGGGPGIDGAPATVQRAAQRGTNGGMGGNGGRKADGGRGGDGGTIHLTVPKDALELLLLVETDVRAGEGGAPGEKHGEAGAGGKLGIGGNALRYAGRERGLDGFPGADGKEALSLAKRGTAGKDGEFHIHVIDVHGEKVYQSIFDLRFEGMEVVDDDGDGAVAPGELVTIRNIRVRNVGGTPTPKAHSIQVALRMGSWVVPVVQTITIDRSLSAEDGTYVVPGELTFRVPEIDRRTRSAARRFAATAELILEAGVPAVGRALPMFTAKTLVPVSLPVEIQSLEMLPSVTPGGKARVRMTVRNLSTRQLGSGTRSGQTLTGTVKLDWVEGNGHEMTLVPQGMAALDGKWRAVENIQKLKPGETTVVEAVVEVDPRAPAFMSFDLSSDVTLASPKGDSSRVVERLSQTLKVAPAYDTNPSDVVLVTNSSTGRWDYSTLRQQLEAWGLSVRVWDLSLHGRLPLEDPDFAQSLHGSSLVLLNYEFETPVGRLTPQSFLDPEALARAQDAHGVSVLVAGARAHYPEGWIQAQTVPGRAEWSESHASWKAWRDIWKLRVGDFPTGDRGFDSSEFGQLIEIDRTAWRTPTVRSREREIHRIIDVLESKFPYGRYYLIPRYPTTMERGALSWRGYSWHLGQVEVRRRGDWEQGALVGLFAEAELMQDPKYLEGYEMASALFLTLPFETKLKMFQRYLGGVVPIEQLEQLSALVDTLVIDITRRASPMVRPAWSASVVDAVRERALASLEKLAELELAEPMKVGSKAFAQLGLLTAKLEFWSDGQRAWMDLLPGRARGEYSRKLRAALDRLWERVLTGQPSALSVARTTIEAHKRQYRRTVGKHLSVHERRHQIQQWMESPFRQRGIHSDRDALSIGRVIRATEHELEGTLARRQVATEARREVEGQIAASYASLNCPQQLAGSALGQ